MSRTAVIGLLLVLGTLFCAPASDAAASGSVTHAAPIRLQVPTGGRFASRRLGVRASSPMATITGQVLNGATPVSGAQVEAFSLEQCSIQSLNPTDAMGNYTLTGGACHWELWAVGTGIDPITTTVVNATAGGTVTGQNIAVGQPTQQLTGTVTSAGGAPVNNASVTLALPSKLTNNPTLFGFAETSTGSNGAYTVSAPAGTFTLAVTANTYENYTHTGVALPGSFNPVLTPYPAVISGRLLNGPTPITNWTPRVATIEGCNFQTPDPSDSMGNYVIYGEACHYELYMAAQNFNTAQSTVVDASAGGTFSGQNVVAAPRSQHLTGTLVRPEGNPVAGASISLFMSSRLVPGGTLDSVSNATTGADGTFSLTAASGSYTVIASGDRYHAYTQRGVSVPSTLNPVLTPYPVTVTGQTFNAATPVAMGALQVTTSEDSCNFNIVGNGAAFTVFGDYCHYELSAYEGGGYMSIGTAVVDATTGQTYFSGQNIPVAPATQTLTGTVSSSAGGAPIYAATVSVRIPSKLRQGETVEVASTTSAANGSYSMNVASGTFEVDASANGFHTFARSGVPSPATLNPALQPFSVALSGQLLNGTRPISNQQISVESLFGSNCQWDNSTVTDTFGKYSLGLDPNCRYELWLANGFGNNSGFNSTSTTLISTSGGGAMDGPTLQATPTLQSLSGTALIDRGATRAEDATISLSLPSQLNSGELQKVSSQLTTADGTFQVPVASGTYHVDAALPGTLTFSQPGVAVPGNFNPVLVASACLPRPPIQQNIASNGHGGLSVIVEESGSGVHLKALQFGPTSNGLIDVQGMAPGSTGNMTVSVAGQTATSFTIRQQAPGGFTNAPYTVIDDCGSWPTFAGGGPSAFVATTTNLSVPSVPAPAPPSGGSTRGHSSAPTSSRVDATSGGPSVGGRVSVPLPPPVPVRQVSRPVVMDLTPPAVVDVTPPAAVDVPPAQVVDVSLPAVVDVTPPAAVDVPPAQAVDVSLPAVDELTPPAVVGDETPPAAVDDAPLASDDGLSSIPPAAVTLQDGADPSDESAPPDG